jgi:hypothetical protein
VTATNTRPDRVLRAKPSGPRARTVALTAAVAGVVTLVVRLALHVHGFDLYGDEIVYTNLGRSVISGGFPNFEGQIFFLHGPGFFYLEAGWARLIGTQPSLTAWVYAMRMLNGLLAAATAAVVVLLVTRISSLRAGAIAAALFAVDPFCIRQNDRVLLETSMMLWMLLGYLVFMPLIGRESTRRDWPRAVAAGLLFGCAVLTKDEAALITVLPLLVAAIARWGPRRPATLLTVATTAAVYAVYVAVVAANGYFSVFWENKTFGIQRMLGLVQITGFHSSGGGSLSGRLLSEAAIFWSTYLVLLLAVPMMLLMLRYGSARPRILALVCCAAGLTLAYAVVFGTLEEQELYLLAIPSLLIISVAAAELSRRSRESRAAAGRPPRQAPGVAMAMALTLALGLNAVTCVQWARQPDDAFMRLYAYVQANIPQGSEVGAVEGDINTQYSLEDNYQVGYWETPAALSASRARYLVVQWGPIMQGYSDLTVPQVDSLIGHAQPLFSAWGRTNGRVVLYKLPLPKPVHPSIKHQ